MDDEVRLTAPVKAVAVADALDAHFAGAYSFKEAPEGSAFWGWIRFRCPCGCDAFHQLPVGMRSKPAAGVDPHGVKATWLWDGDRERPTLTPSIAHRVGIPDTDPVQWRNHWHGFLTKGFFTQA